MIVFCHLLNDSSGSPRILRSAIGALSGAGCGNRLYVGGRCGGVLDTSGIEIRRYWYRRTRWRPVTLFTYLASQLSLFVRLMRARDIPRDALVYVNTLLPFAAGLWGRWTGRRVIYHLHEVSISPRVLRWFLMGVAAKTADHVFYVSDDHRKRMPIARVSATTLLNPIEQDFLRLGTATEYAPRRSGQFMVLMLASPRDFKGVPEFLNLARDMATRTDVRFTLVLNADAVEIAAYLGKMLVPNTVTVHSRVSDPAPFYATADVVLNLSRVDLWIETSGLTLAEAMAFGVPVIAPPIGGPVELLGDGVGGLLLDSRDGKLLASAVAKLIDDPALCISMSNAARAKAATLSWSVFAERLRSEVAAVRSRRNDG